MSQKDISVPAFVGLFGRALTEARASKKISQQDLASMLDMTQQAVAKWESGASIPTRRNLTRLVEVFGVFWSDVPMPGDHALTSEDARVRPTLVYMRALAQGGSPLEAFKRIPKAIDPLLKDDPIDADLNAQSNAGRQIKKALLAVEYMRGILTLQNTHPDQALLVQTATEAIDSIQGAISSLGTSLERRDNAAMPAKQRQ